jgi:uncharacterized protein (DUF885 family)
MDIPFPSWLQWVSYLAGSHWPQGSETAWWRTAEHLRATAGEVEALIPELARVRAHTRAVLAGDTAAAADAQFAMLFEGKQSVDALVAGLRTLGDAAENLGTEIQYAKLQIITMLAVAAASIIWALANCGWTAGGSLAQIPIIRWLTDNAIARLVAMVLGRIEAELASRLGSILVARLLVEGAVSAGIGAAQEAGVEGVQVLEGRRDGVDVGQVVHSALSMGAAGAAGGLAGQAVGELLGRDGSTVVRALNGAVSGLASGEAANLAGTLAGGGNVDAATFLGGAIGVVHGGVHGATGHATPVDEPTEAAAPVNAIDTHPTLRLQRQPDGTFAWPGETTTDAATTGTAADGGPHAAAALPPATVTEPPAGDRVAGATGVWGARELATRSSDLSAATNTPTDGEAAGHGVRSSSALLTAADTGPASVAGVRAGVDPAAPSGAAGGPSGQPPSPLRVAADPGVTPTASAGDGPNPGLSSPTPDTRAGVAEPATVAKSTFEQAGAPAARAFDTTLLHADPDADDTTSAEQPAAMHATGVDRAAQAGRPEVSSHVAGREDNSAADRQRRSADPVTKRQDASTRLGSTRRDSGTSPRGRPGKLHRSDVARDVSCDLQPAATRTPDPLPAAEETGIITARHDHSDPGPGEPEPHNGSSDGSGGSNTPHPGTAGGGAGDYRGADGGGGGDGGAGHGEEGIATPRQIADDYMRALARRDPSVAVDVGWYTWDIRLPDFSADGLAAYAELARGTLGDLDRAATPGARDDSNRRCALLLRERLTTELSFYETGEFYSSVRTVPTLSIARPMFSPLNTLRKMLSNLSPKTDEQWRVLGGLLAQVRPALQQYRSTLAEGIARGHVAGAGRVQAMVDQLNVWTGGQRQGRWFGSVVAGVPDRVRDELVEQAVIANAALGELAQWLTREYAPAAAERPDAVGRERYQLWARWWLGAEVDPDEAFASSWEKIHELRAKMEAQANRIWPGSTAREVMNRLSRERVIVGTDNIQRWMQGVLDGALADLQGTQFDIPEPLLSIYARIAPTGTPGMPYYTPPSLDFSRSGRVWLPLPPELDWVGPWNLVSLLYHEGVPGHHLERGYSTLSVRELSVFQRNCIINGHFEGWALYAERRMDELGKYDDPGDRLGYLQNQMLREVRVVLGIGLHLGWRFPLDGHERSLAGEQITPRTAWEFLRLYCPSADRTELNRYLSTPAHEGSYRLGERKWLEARNEAAKAARRRGVRFELKDWHKAALSLGTLGLDDLVDELGSIEPQGDGGRGRS